MRTTVLILGWAVLTTFLLVGCVSKSTADARVRAAFLAGQQQAAQQPQFRGPSVTVMGEVRNSIVPWTADLTLAKAIFAADYYGTDDPVEIVVIRANDEIRIDPRNLLEGADIPLQPRDVIDLRR